VIMKIFKKTVLAALTLCLAVLCVAFCASNASAASVTASGSCGDTTTWTLYDDGHLVIEGSGAIKNGDAWKDFNLDVTSVTIGDKVTSIGDYSFYDFQAMKTLKIGSKVETIGHSAFSNCKSLVEVVIPANVKNLAAPYWGDEYGVFENCTRLKTVTIGDEEWQVSPTTIGADTFLNCPVLETVYIGNGVETIGNSAFSGCVKLKNVTIGTSVTTIGDSAFNNCELLPGIVIPDSVTSIGEYAFYNCLSMRTVDFGESVNTIGHSAFTNCKSLTEVVIPANVKNLAAPYWGDEYGVFENCIKLKTVTIGDEEWQVSPTTIGADTFLNCTALETVYIGNGVETIGNSAFSGCVKLENITIGTSVTTIGDSAFKNCELLSGIDISDSVTSIGEYAFYNCQSMKTVDFGESVKTIGHSAFTNCKSLTEVVIPANVKTLAAPYWGDEYGVFENCTSLKKVIIGDTEEQVSLTLIGADTFAGCTSLRMVVIGNGVETVEKNAFYSCSSLEKVIVLSSTVNFKDIPFNKANAGLTFHGYRDSTAESYAAANNFAFRLLGSFVGDVNCDYEVDISDALHLFMYSMLPDQYPISYKGNIDFNHDGSVDISDALRLFMHSMLPQDYPIS